MGMSSRLGMVVLAFVGVACGSDEPGAGTGAAGVLVKGSPTPADDTCKGGGTKVEVGSDWNGNGQLDPDEVTGAQVVCGNAVLTTVTPSGPSAKCKNGGTIVKSGLDTNGDGKLDGDEVKETTEICGGGTSTELSTSNAIGEGDPSCPFGGVKTDTGLDNGANGSVAGDGILQPGEVISSRVACVGGASGSFIPPAGPAGTGQILLTGGAGATAAGGKGGDFRLLTQSGSSDGQIKVFKTGKVDADFTIPDEVVDFGATKLDVTANKTIASYESNAAAAVGEYYTVNGSGLFFKESTSHPQVLVTGVHVAPNVTLTFPASGISFTISDDFHNEGTITSGVSGLNRGFLSFNAGKFVGGATSKIDLTGSGDGGRGGPLALVAGRIINAGSIDTSGADTNTAGTAGGNAGAINVLAARTGLSGPCIQAGDVRSKGGNGKAAGGVGGAQAYRSNVRGTFVKGVIDTSGGGGGAYGAGAYVFMMAFGGGTVQHAGPITTAGGDASEVACAGACTGGRGGDVSFLGTRLLHDGDVITRGGKGKDAVGGDGGGFYADVPSGSDPLSGAQTPPGAVRLSGKLDLRAGSGSQGGDGGPVVIGSSDRPTSIELLGYETVDLGGGNGAAGGGASGIVTLDTSATGPSPLGGGIANHAAIIAKGGNALTSGVGGSGGIVTMRAGAPGGAATKSQVIISVGSIDASGGNGVSAGGLAGALEASSRERIDLLGGFTASGGSQTAASGTSGGTSPSSLRTGGAIVINAPLTLEGGNAAGMTSSGGMCSGLTISGASVRATAAISCAGGNGNGAAGGNGGTTNIASTFASTVLAGVTTAGGTGSPAGTPGLLIIDGNMQ